MWPNPHEIADLVLFTHLLKKSSMENFIFCAMSLSFNLSQGT